MEKEDYNKIQYIFTIMTKMKNRQYKFGDKLVSSARGAFRYYSEMDNIHQRTYAYLRAIHSKKVLA